MKKQLWTVKAEYEDGTTYYYTDHTSKRTAVMFSVRLCETHNDVSTKVYPTI